MELGDRAEEVLETLWIAIREGGEAGVDRESLDGYEVDRLREFGLVAVSDGMVGLTDAGFPEARSVVRRHRLAERLLSDVLGAADSVMHETACRFEHLLDKGLDDSICTLLGHPKVCPHGKPIPAGRCCEEDQAETGQVVSPLSHLAPGAYGKVAYIYAPEAEKLQKLMAMGILPGVPIRLLQKFPSFVFQAGHTQFAVDEQIADAVYVRLVEEEAPVPTRPAVPFGGRRRRGRRRWFSGRW